jgi:6-phosphogluconolactonase
MSKPPNIQWALNSDAHAVARHIASALKGPGPFTLAVPGGRTPLPIFAALSELPLPWEKITVMLGDDRIVPIDHPASNQAKLQAAFGATNAQILSLEEGMTLPKFDMVWLGMGGDGHIASLFPNMDPDVSGAPAVLHTVPDPLPPEAPFERLTFNMAALINTKQIILTISGADKKHVLDAAIAGENDLPIARLMAAAQCPVTIFWSSQ